MVLVLQEIKDHHEFGPLTVAFRKGFIHPGHALWPLYTADLKPYDDEQVSAVLKECAERFATWHYHDLTSTWLQVVDEMTGEIVAGGRWSIYKRDSGNPYDDHAHFEATWFPEGKLRTIATKLLNEFLASAAKHANYPHAFLNIIFTVPEHRRRGAASLIMDWGMEQAKRYELDVFIEATPEGKPLYERYGFDVIERHSLGLGELEVLLEKDQNLRSVVHENLVPLTWTSMLKRAN